MFLDWFAFILGIVGGVLIAKKFKIAWVLFLMSNILWIIYAIKTRQLALTLECLSFGIVNVYGWTKWNKKL